MVIDHLHDDQKSLFACSLVSRRWLPSCRFHLFRTITINDVKDEDDFKDVLSFFETHHGIPPIVRQLYVMGVFVSTPSLTLRSIGSLAIGFPNLHTLKLHNMKWTKSSSFVERHSVPAVRNLHLSNINISGGTRPLFDMMSVFPGLEALSMDYVHVPRDEIDHLRYLPEMDLPDRHLRKVSIHTSHVMLQFLGYIQITSSSRSLESLSISIPSSGVTRVGEFLRDVGPNLRDLHLRFTFPTPCFHVSEGESPYSLGSFHVLIHADLLTTQISGIRLGYLRATPLNPSESSFRCDLAIRLSIHFRVTGDISSISSKYCPSTYAR